MLAVPEWLLTAREAGQAFQAWATPVLLAIGGAWAFYRFRRQRTLKERLELEVSGSVAPGAYRLRLTATLKATNVGRSVFRIEQAVLSVWASTDEALEHGAAAGGEDAVPTMVEWKLLGDWTVFEGKEALEPDEPFVEELVVRIPDGGGAYDALRLALEVWRGVEGGGAVGEPFATTKVVALEPRVHTRSEGSGAAEGRPEEEV